MSRTLSISVNLHRAEHHVAGAPGVPSVHLAISPELRFGERGLDTLELAALRALLDLAQVAADRRIAVHVSFATTAPKL